MRVEITGGKAMATVRRPDWSVTVHANGTTGLSVWCGCGRPKHRMHVQLSGESLEEILRALEGIRDRLGTVEPLAQEVRDAVAACRRELERHDGYSEVRRKSRFDVFGELCSEGWDPDEAARAAGGTGRP